MLFKFTRKARGSKGFTLIELMMAIVILGIIAGIAVPIYINNKNSSEAVAAKTDVTVLSQAISDAIAIGSAITGYTGTADGATPLNGSISTVTSSQTIGDATLYYNSSDKTWCVSKLKNGVYYFNNSNTKVAQSSTSGCYNSTSQPNGPTAVVTGGTLSSDSTYYYRTFLADGTLTVTGGSLSVDSLVVAGGGSSWNAGSGAGGALGTLGTVIDSNTYPVVVGLADNNSSFNSEIAIRGGCCGADGGSGGGGVGGAGGLGTPGQGNNGGSGSWGGGGGAGGPGNPDGGNGGPGTCAYSAWASATGTGDRGCYAGGGGGYPYGLGGIGGGANAWSDAMPNTGGGAAIAGSAGSGIVIIRYLKSAVAGG